jgi:hypothetical protein
VKELEPEIVQTTYLIRPLKNRAILPVSGEILGDQTFKERAVLSNQTLGPKHGPPPFASRGSQPRGQIPVLEHVCERNG